MTDQTMCKSIEDTVDIVADASAHALRFIEKMSDVMTALSRLHEMHDVVEKNISAVEHKFKTFEGLVEKLGSDNLTAILHLLDPSKFEQVPSDIRLGGDETVTNKVIG